MMRWLPLALVLACGGGKSPAESVAPEAIDTGDTTTPVDTAEPVTPSSFEVKGIVVDRGGTPVPDANPAPEAGAPTTPKAFTGSIPDDYDRHLGPETPVAIPRGANRLAEDGGLMIAPPFT